MNAPFKAATASPAQAETAPAWLTETHGPADPDGTWGGLSLDDMLHDHGFRCEACEEVFGSQADMAEEIDQPELETVCFWCRWGYAKSGEGRVAA